MKKAILILGVNGSGKSSFYKKYLRESFEKENILYINADEIKQQLVKDGIEGNRAKIKSGHLAVEKMGKCIKEDKNFAFETTFTDSGATGSIAIVKELKKQNYEVEGYFIHTKDVNINISRVLNRATTNTGHFVPANIIKERYDLCVNNVKEYSNLFDKFHYIDNTNLDFKLSNEKILETQNNEQKKPFILKEKDKSKNQDIER